MEENAAEQVYSYHTFLFPFIWKTDKIINGQRKKVKLKEFLDVINADTSESRWIAYDWEKRKQKEGFLSDHWMQDYQTYQYFTESANEMIFNCKGSNTVRCYYYSNAFSKKGKYIITKRDKSYTLNINNIRLNVYDAGIAVLIMEMENCSHRSLDDVNLINEYGRRINFPYLASGVDHNLCADSIEIRFGEKAALELKKDNPFIQNYKQLSLNILSTRIKAGYKNTSSKKKAGEILKEDDISFTSIMKPIRTLLDGDKKILTANPEHKDRPDKFYIKPCVDDRMFVCCIVTDSGLSNEIKCIGSDELCCCQDINVRLEKVGCTFTLKDDVYTIKSSAGKEYTLKEENFEAKVGQYQNGSRTEYYIVPDRNNELHDLYMEGAADETTLSARLYKFMYIEKDLSCQNPEMRKRILSESVYDRWVQMGIIYGITHHSVCCITNPSVVNEVINPFLIEYVQMAAMVLVQRSVIIMLEDEVAAVSNKFKENTDVSESDIREIERLQAKYVKIQNQILLSEVTAQEQGVEVYRMIRKQLYIQDNLNDLDMSMSNLRDISEYTNDRLERRSDEAEDKKLNVLSIGLALMFIIEPLSMLFSYIWRDNREPAQAIIWSVASLAIIAVIFIIAKVRPQKNKKKE